MQHFSPHRCVTHTNIPAGHASIHDQIFFSTFMQQKCVRIFVKLFKNYILKSMKNVFSEIQLLHNELTPKIFNAPNLPPSTLYKGSMLYKFYMAVCLKRFVILQRLSLSKITFHKTYCFWLSRAGRAQIWPSPAFSISTSPPVQSQILKHTELFLMISFPS